MNKQTIIWQRNRWGAADAEVFHSLHVCLFWCRPCIILWIRFSSAVAWGIWETGLPTVFPVTIVALAIALLVGEAALLS